MREIKFRGKSQIDGKWVYGSLIMKESQIPNLDNLNELKYIKYYEICCKDENDWASQYYNIPVFENSIGQFTGLKDKNGKEIYEDDIVLVSKMAKAIIIWNSEDACFAFDYGQDGRPFCLDLITDTSIEGIGNRFDNPELLEEQDNE